jgi:hypothetical protein
LCFAACIKAQIHINTSTARGDCAPRAVTATIPQFPAEASQSQDSSFGPENQPNTEDAVDEDHAPDESPRNGLQWKLVHKPRSSDLFHESPLSRRIGKIESNRKTPSHTLAKLN